VPKTSRGQRRKTRKARREGAAAAAAAGAAKLQQGPEQRGKTTDRASHWWVGCNLEIKGIFRPRQIEHDTFISRGFEKIITGAILPPLQGRISRGSHGLPEVLPGFCHPLPFCPVGSHPIKAVSSMAARRSGNMPRSYFPLGYPTPSAPAVHSIIMVAPIGI
jgi:hypothetical protein